MNTKNLQRGFSLLISLLILGLVIAGGVYIYKNKKATISLGNLNETKASSDIDVIKNMKQQANEAAQALINKNFEKFSTFAYPKIVEALGGKEKYIQIMKGGLPDGAVLSKISIGEPSKIVDTGTELQAVLSQTLEIKISDGTLISKGLLVAISSDKGASWYFIDTGGNTLERIRMQLPNLSTKLVITSLDKPVFYKN